MSKKKKAKKKKVCFSGGYAYRLSSDYDPFKASHDKWWEIVMVSTGPAGTFQGHRTIDGADMVVTKKGRYYFAQNALHVKDC